MRSSKRRRRPDRLSQVDVWRWWGIFAQRIQHSGLQMENVIPESIVLGLHNLERVLQVAEFAYLLFKLLDISLLTLAERSLPEKY